MKNKVELTSLITLEAVEPTRFLICDDVCSTLVEYGTQKLHEGFR